jgi:hypothetical protein
MFSNYEINIWDVHHKQYLWLANEDIIDIKQDENVKCVNSKQQDETTKMLKLVRKKQR